MKTAPSPALPHPAPRLPRGAACRVGCLTSVSVSFNVCRLFVSVSFNLCRRSVNVSFDVFRVRRDLKRFSPSEEGGGVGRGEWFVVVPPLVISEEIDLPA